VAVAVPPTVLGEVARMVHRLLLRGVPGAEDGRSKPRLGEEARRSWPRLRVLGEEASPKHSMQVEEALLLGR